MGRNDGIGRRASDIAARWATAAAAFLSSCLLGIIIFFYGNLPKDIAELRESVTVIKFQVGDIQDQQKEMIDAMRGSQKLTERVTIIEQKLDRQAEQIGTLQKRVEKVEDKPAALRGRP